MGVKYIRISLWEVYDIFINKRNLEKSILNFVIYLNCLTIKTYSSGSLQNHEHLERVPETASYPLSI